MDLRELDDLERVLAGFFDFNVEGPKFVITNTSMRNLVMATTMVLRDNPRRHGEVVAHMNERATTYRRRIVEDAVRADRFVTIDGQRYAVIREDDTTDAFESLKPGRW